MEEKVLLFSYGTLQDNEVQLATFGRRLTGKPDSILGFTKSLLMIEDLDVVELSGEAQHPVVHTSSNPLDEVPGTVFEITMDELLAADEYEVDDYERVLVPLKSGLKAWLYVGVRQPQTKAS